MSDPEKPRPSGRPQLVTVEWIGIAVLIVLLAIGATRLGARMLDRLGEEASSAAGASGGTGQQIDKGGRRARAR